MRGARGRFATAVRNRIEFVFAFNLSIRKIQRAKGGGRTLSTWGKVMVPEILVKYNRGMSKETKKKLLDQLVALVSTAMLGAILAIAQSALSQHGVSCGPEASPAVAAGSAGVLRLALMGLTTGRFA